MPNTGALTIGQALKAAGFDAPAIANALIAPDVYPTLQALDVGQLLLDASIFPTLTAAQMRAALTAAPFPANVIDAAEATLYPSAASALLWWDFANTTSAGPVSTSVGVARGTGLTGTMSQTGGGPFEVFPGSTPVFLTRRFGTEFPFIEFTVAVPTRLRSVTFAHFHNHNPGFSSNPSYWVQLQLDTGSGYADIGAAIVASPATDSTTAFVDLGEALLPAGRHRLRWFPKNLNRGATDTSTEYFALHNVVLSTSASAALTWDFSRMVNSGARSRCEAGAGAAWSSAVLTQTGGGPAETWSIPQPVVFLTRFLGSQYPYIEVTATAPMRLEGVSFRHFHNHNPGFPSNPSYLVQLQLGDSNRFTNLGQAFTVSSANHGGEIFVDLGGQAVTAGTFQLRWFPRQLRNGAQDTNTEFFAFQDLTLLVSTS
jgi:hypothetical protein